ncbi:hypothetical protein ACFLZZ_02910 [Nanoarchaeota archaeon]
MSKKHKKKYKKSHTPKDVEKAVGNLRKKLKRMPYFTELSGYAPWAAKAISNGDYSPTIRSWRDFLTGVYSKEWPLVKINDTFDKAMGSSEKVLTSQEFRKYCKPAWMVLEYGKSDLFQKYGGYVGFRGLKFPEKKEKSIGLLGKLYMESD